MQALHRQGLAIAASVALASGSAVAATDPAGLVGSHWQLIQFQSNDDHQPPLQPSGAATYTLSLLSGGRARLQLDCNQALGSWTAAPSRDRSNGTFAFGPLAQTRMICPEPTLEPALTAKLPWVRSYRLEGSQLFLALMADGGILSWQRLDGSDGQALWRVRQLGQPVPLRDFESESSPPRR
jgi:heat shock protein HslJ